MKTCSRCNTQSHDRVTHCSHCNADLNVYSSTAVALKRFQENPRVRDVRIVVAHDCCPACSATEGTYKKGEVSLLPIEGCSYPLGCRCFFEPMLKELYP